VLTSSSWGDETNFNFTTFPNATNNANFTSLQSLVCVPSYNISKGLVSVKDDGSVVNVITNTLESVVSSNQLDNIAAMDVASGVISSLVNAEAIISSTSVFTPIENIRTQFDTFIQICNLISPQSNSSAFLEPAFLNQVARQTYKSISIQVAKQGLMIASEKHIIGSLSANTNRLYVRELSLRIMEATLALLCLIACAICKIRPSGSTPRDPGTIAGLASIIARSSGFSDTVASSGTASLGEIATTLSGNTYQTVVSNQIGSSKFSIEPLSQLTKKQSNKPLLPTTVTWWHPFSVSILARTLVIIIPIALIAALEATYQRSQHDDGIADVQAETYIKYTWVYVPALVSLNVVASQIHHS